MSDQTLRDLATSIKKPNVSADNVGGPGEQGNWHKESISLNATQQFWEEIIRSIRRRANSLNQRISKKIVIIKRPGFLHIEVRSLSARYVELKLLADLGEQSVQVRINGRDHPWTYSIVSVEGGRLAIRQDNGIEFIDLEEFADHLLIVFSIAAGIIR